MTLKRNTSRTKGTKEIFLISFLCFLCFLCSAFLLSGQGQRVVAIGDVHGDFDAFVAILQRARLIDPSNRWSGGNAVLVQTGDFLDRGPKARAVMDLLMSLQKDAPRQGGRLIVLMGNHEAMNIYGDLRYVTEADYASFADSRPDSRRAKADALPPRPVGFVERCAAFGPDGRYGKWLRSLPAIARVNDSIFVHGGITPDISSESIEKLNDAIANELKSFDGYKEFIIDKKIAPPCSTLAELTMATRTALDKAKGKDAEILKAFLSYGGWLSIHENGPLWFRGYAQWTDLEGGPKMESLAQTYGVARFVVGHTPQAGGKIVSRFDGKVYLIDTGMLSSYFPGGHASALNIQDGQISFIH
jgi:hypothetical protein